MSPNRIRTAAAAMAFVTTLSMLLGIDYLARPDTGAVGTVIAALAVASPAR